MFQRWEQRCQQHKPTTQVEVGVINTTFSPYVCNNNNSHPVLILFSLVLGVGSVENCTSPSFLRDHTGQINSSHDWHELIFKKIFYHWLFHPDFVWNRKHKLVRFLTSRRPWSPSSGSDGPPTLVCMENHHVQMFKLCQIQHLQTPSSSTSLPLISLVHTSRSVPHWQTCKQGFTRSILKSWMLKSSGSSWFFWGEKTTFSKEKERER